MFAPPRQRGAYFALIPIPIIDRLDATLDMIDRKLGHVRRNYLVGDTVTVNVVRGGRRVDVKLTLK